MEYTIGTAVFNDWIITREIGQGATGRVYEIEKKGYGEKIRAALKIIKIPRDPSDIKSVMSEGMTEADVTEYFKEFVDEILKEIKIMVSLKEHPNIVTYEDHSIYSHEDGIGCDILIKMELLTPFQDWQMKHPMDERKILQLGCEISSALAYAAEHGLMHRDVKPENIFVDSLGRFKLGDFGIARTIEKTTSGLSQKGTQNYMAPEVYIGRKYGAAVDIYSLGMVLYRLLNNNRLPFYPPITEKISYSDKENALLKRIQGEPVPEPQNGSQELKKIVLKACEYRPENRYVSMAEMHSALSKLKMSEDIETKSDFKDWADDVTDVITKKPKNKKRGIIAGILATVVVVSAVMAVFWIQSTKKYELTVENGSGDGEYKKGTKVAITAEEPEYGKTFKGWEIKSGNIEIPNLNESSVEFVMPNENVEITATYEDIRYRLTVEGGNGSGDFAEGETVQISADIQPNLKKYNFRWKVTEDDSGDTVIEEPDQLSTVLQMPAHDLTVSYDLKMYLTSESGYSVYVPAPNGWEYYKGYADDLSAGVISTKEDKKDDRIKVSYYLESYDPSIQTVDVSGYEELSLDIGKNVYYSYKENEGELWGVYMPREGEVLSFRTDSASDKITEKFGTEEDLVKILFGGIEET